MTTVRGLSSRLTVALKLIGGRREQQFSLHPFGSGAASDARLLVSALDPVGEPHQAAVAVQRVGSDGAGDKTQEGVYGSFSKHLKLLSG